MSTVYQTGAHHGNVTGCGVYRKINPLSAKFLKIYLELEWMDLLTVTVA